MNIIHTNSWRIEPFKHSRPFVPLRQYRALQLKHERLKKKVREQKENDKIQTV